MAKRVTLKIELTLTGYDDQIDFMKEELRDDLAYQAMRGSSPSYIVEDVPDDEIDDFLHEMKEAE